MRCISVGSVIITQLCSLPYILVKYFLVFLKVSLGRTCLLINTPLGLIECHQLDAKQTEYLLKQASENSQIAFVQPGFPLILCELSQITCKRDVPSALLVAVIEHLTPKTTKQTTKDGGTEGGREREGGREEGLILTGKVHRPSWQGRAWLQDPDAAGHQSQFIHSQKAKSRQEVETGYTTSRPAPNDPLPPVRLCILKVPQSPKMKPHLRPKGSNT